MSEPQISAITQDVWVARRSLPLVVGDIGARMTILRLGSELLIHSPVKLDDPTRAAVDALGRVKWIVAPSKMHHLFAGAWAAAFPDALLCGAPGLAKKRADLTFHHALSDGSGAELWRGLVASKVVWGAPMQNEVALLHAPSGTLVLADLVFNVRRDGRNDAKLFHRLVGCVDRFGPHRVVRLGFRDKAAVRRDIDAILAWEFDRVVMAHGEVLSSGGKDALRAAFAYLR